MTVLLSCTMSGFLLPPHLIYCGKTNKCHPNIILPPGWDIHHSESHWSTEDTMLHFIESAPVPYVQSTRKRLGLEKCDPAVLHTLRLHGLIAKDLHEKLKHFQDRFGIVLSNGLYCEAEWTRRMKFLKVSQNTISPFSISL